MLDNVSKLVKKVIIDAKLSKVFIYNTNGYSLDNLLLHP